MKSPATGILRLGVVTLMLSCLLMTLTLRLPEGAPAPLQRLFNSFAPEAEAAATHFGNGKIAFQTQRTGNFEIFLMNPNGNNPVNISNNPAIDANPGWSLDGTKIAFDSTRDGDTEIYVMNADGSNQTRLTFSALIDGDPSFSPDGTKIVFQSRRAGNFDIFVMNADGSNQTQLTNAAGNDLHPSFSPDGTKIIFDSLRDGNAEIYIMNADGSNETRLTNNPTADQAPSFSPNGKKIAFQRHINSQAQVMTMNPDGSNQTQLTSTTGSKFSPAFSPDGNSISFTAGTNNDEEIFIMRADGTGPNPITSSVGDDISAAWQYLPVPDTVGVYRPSTRQFLLRNANAAGSPNITLTFGQAGDLPVAGDWNGDGTDDIGVFRNGQFLLRQPITFLVFGQPHTTVITITLNFGEAGDLPVVGDWNGDGIDTPGVFRPSTGEWFLTNGPNTNNTTPPINLSFTFGQPSDVPVVGDWDGNGTDTVGVFRVGAGCSFLLTNDNSTIDISANGFCIASGIAAQPIIGDWNGDGIDTDSVRDPSTNTFFLRNNNDPFAAPPDFTFTFGQDGDIPLSGDWDGKP